MKYPKWMTDDLAKSGLTAKNARTALIEYKSKASMRKIIKRADVSDGYAIPYMLGGEKVGVRYKLREPLEYTKDGKQHQIRYYQRTGTPPMLYAPAGIPRGDLIICEGEKKTLKLIAEGYAAVGLSGVWNFMSSKHGIDLLDELKRAAKSGRTFKIAFDGNVLTKKPVLKARERLATLLVQHGGRVVLVDVPNGQNLDDFIVQQGKDAFDRLPEIPWHAPGSALPPFSLDPIPAEWLDEEPPSIQYTIDGLLIRETVAMLVAEGGTGKSYLVEAMARAVATGTRFLGMGTTKGRVIYLALEDPESVLQRRLFWSYRDVATSARTDEAKKRYRDRLLKNLTAVSLVGQELHLIGLEQNVAKQTPALNQLIAKLRDGPRPELVVLDPMSRLHGTDENGNAIGTALVNCAERIALEVGCAVLIVHHTGKGKAKDDSSYATRGASGIADAARTVLRLRLLQPDELTKITNLPAGVSEVLKLTHSKTNYAKRRPDIYLVRKEHGGLKLFDAQIKTAAGEYESWLVQLRKWSIKHPTAFSKRTIEKAFKALSRGTLRNFLADAETKKHIVPAGVGKGGGKLFKLPEVASEK